MINLAKKFKSVIAVIAFGIGALVASQAHAYTINDYNSAVAQLNAAAAGAAAADAAGSAAYAASQNEYQIYLYNITSCQGDQYAVNDCLNGYIAEYETNMQNHSWDMMFHEAERLACLEQVAYWDELRILIAAELGL